MSIVDKKYGANKEGTVFLHGRTGKVLCAIDAKLSRTDWEQIHTLFNFIYNQGVTAGSTDRAAEIRRALGI
ncbi:hypothetical protein [Salmonella enterica]|uniref:hypothetical protein n=1 Tax=Salmonella enterica TaxID=28901 RepID=UPI0026DD960B|nr:hypothetical protein [Salmonella enterica]MDO3920410.1 hypothetical protein [Salmonella enterica]